MSSELTPQGEEWRGEAKEWYERALVVKADARELKLDLAENLLEGHDKKYYKAIGYTRFEDFCQEFYGISKPVAYQYIQIARNVLQALPDEMSALQTFGDNLLPLRVLAALHFDQKDFTPEVVERLRKMEPEERKKELLKLGYDRERMGGRGPADLLRKLRPRKVYRDQSRTIRLLKEQGKTKDAVIAEANARAAQAEERLAAVEDPEGRKAKKMIEDLLAENAKLKEDKAEQEAKVSAGKEVHGACLRLINQQVALCNAFYDHTKIDTAQEWAWCLDAFEQAEQAIGDLMRNMAENIIARGNAGEIEQFDTDAPRDVGDSAALTLRRFAKGKKGLTD